MKICIIGKYPPIEGGVSSKVYWLAKGLGNKGHEIHIVTNAWEVETDFRECLDAEDLKEYQPKNVKVHNTDPFIDPSYIPYAKPYTEKIASLGIDIIREYDLQLIDSWYILPYVVSGFICKTLTKKPQILRHAGSDISRLFDSPFLNTLFMELFKSVNKIVTYQSTAKWFLDWGIPESKIFLNNNESVDTKAFNPNAKPMDLSKYKNNIEGLPVITYIGKTSTSKGIFEFIQALSELKEDFVSLFVTRGGRKLKDKLKAFKLEEKSIVTGFLPPWRIPSAIKVSNCVVLPERDFPILIHNPILLREVMATGVCSVISNEIGMKFPDRSLEDGVNTIIVNPKDISQFKNKLNDIITDVDSAQNIGREAIKISQKIENFDDYIKKMEKLYKELTDISS